MGNGQTFSGVCAMTSPPWDSRVEVEVQQSVCISPGKLNVHYGVVTLKGYYPDKHDHENQDAFSDTGDFMTNNDSKAALFGVYDGHGPNGHQIARACAIYFPQKLRESLHKPGATFEGACKATFKEVDGQVKTESKSGGSYSDQKSGTTAILVHVAET